MKSVDHVSTVRPEGLTSPVSRAERRVKPRSLGWPKCTMASTASSPDVRSATSMGAEPTMTTATEPQMRLAAAMAPRSYWESAR